MSKRILVIDDSPFIFKAVKRAAEPHGYEMVGQAFNGQEGLEWVTREKPDIIILDVTMPIMDGLETAKNLQEKNLCANVVMLSAMSDEGLVETAKGYGVKHFLTKPFEPADLITVLNDLAI